MPIIRTRNISDPLSSLEEFIRQSEQAGAGLISVVAGTVEGSPFNVVSYLFESKTLPPVNLRKIQAPIDTDEQQMAVQDQLAAEGLTPLFFAPVFDANEQINVAVCRTSGVDGLTPAGALLEAIQVPNIAEGASVSGSISFSTESSHGSFRGSSSYTTGLSGRETSFSDGTVILEAQETLSAVRGGKNFGSRVVTQRRIQQGNIHTVQQGQYCWLDRDLPNALLVEDFSGFPSDVQVVSAKATQFGKKDPQDEGTGSELLKAVQTNSDVFGASLKVSHLVATFGAPLNKSSQLLNACVEVLNPQSRRFARVPIVDVGPGESEPAQIDLTLALDEFLKTNGGAHVFFRVVV
jgi:hypothetical protein